MRLVHYSNKVVPVVLPPLYGRDDRDSKPYGFWVSVEGKYDWSEWCLNEMFRLKNLTHVHDVVLTSDANVLRLASSYEIDCFTSEYGTLMHGLCHAIDWSRIKGHYQGIIIAPYIWERRFNGGACWYYDWDCASGCIWDPTAIASITLREIVPLSVIENEYTKEEACHGT